MGKSLVFNGPKFLHFKTGDSYLLFFFIGWLDVSKQAERSFQKARELGLVARPSSASHTCSLCRWDKPLRAKVLCGHFSGFLVCACMCLGVPFLEGTESYMKSWGGEILEHLGNYEDFCGWIGRKAWGLRLRGVQDPGVMSHAELELTFSFEDNVKAVKVF